MKSKTLRLISIIIGAAGLVVSSLVEMMDQKEMKEDIKRELKEEMANEKD